MVSFVVRYFPSVIEILGQLCSFSLHDEMKSGMTMSEHLPKKLVKAAIPGRQEKSFGCEK